MPKGSVVICKSLRHSCSLATRIRGSCHGWSGLSDCCGSDLGGTWHGSGANSSDRRRHGLNIDYNLAWLRQEENQYLSVPPEVAAEMPVEIQRLVGYHTYSDALGCAWPFVSLSHPAQ